MRLVWFVILFGLLVIQPVSAEFPVEGTYLSLDSGSNKSYSQFDNQVMLIQAFATYCIPCKAEMYELSRINGVYGSQGANNLSILSLSVSPSTDSLEKIRAFKIKAEDEFGFTASWEYGVDSSTQRSFSEQLSIPVVPTIFLFDENGDISTKWEGRVTADEISAYLDENVTFPKVNPFDSLINQIVKNGFFQFFMVVMIMLVIRKITFPKVPEDRLQD